VAPPLWGDSYYAASAFRDRDGRPGLVFWLRGVHDEAEGWAGAISLPYLLTLDSGRPELVPHDGLDGARTGQRPASALDIVWTPGPADELRLVDDADAPVAILRRDGDRVTVVAGTSVTPEMPCSGDVLRVVLDGPVLEIAGADGLFAVPVPGGSGAIRPLGEAVEWWSLGG